MTYKLSIWYAGTPDDREPQTHTGLSFDQAYSNGFWSDLENLKGEGVRKIAVEVEHG